MLIRFGKRLRKLLRGFPPQGLDQLRAMNPVLERRCHLKTVLALAFASLVLPDLQKVSTAGEPLPSWDGTAPKQALIAFVERVTKEGSPDFVPPRERIATFDNDGTLWAERPICFQFQFALPESKD